ncbi:MAG: phospholipase D-like domain-containing protein [Immundisolibacter sp.]|uniref:phospholipase D-like domain-containing protein n=1 Tax=Immundisolibacter sp. TaxID=1934948 RepID=UPI003D0D64ED
MKIIGGATAGFGFWAWVSFLFAGTGFAMAICIAIIAGGAAMLAYKNEIIDWLVNKGFACKGCGGQKWAALSPEMEQEMNAKDAKIDDLIRIVESIRASRDISERQAQVIENALTNSITSLEVIDGSEHFNVLMRAFAEAKNTVCILSGWIGSPLLDAEIQQLLRAAVKRGVRIFLGFGWESNSGHEISPTAKSALSFVRSLDSSRVMVAQFANHEKVLVVDDEYCIFGSNNWLSNSTFRNSERSILVRIPSFASEEAKRVEAIVRRHGS